jgi:molybdopterin converting factor small subunit
VQHAWLERETQLAELQTQLESAQRMLERQQKQFRAALVERDRHCFQLNQALSDLATGVNDNDEDAEGEDDGNHEDNSNQNSGGRRKARFGNPSSSSSSKQERKRQAAQFLLQNLEQSLHTQQTQLESNLELESKYQQLLLEHQQLQANLATAVAAFHPSASSSSSLASVANQIASSSSSAALDPAALARLRHSLSGQQQSSHLQQAPMAHTLLRRIEELEDALTQHTQQASLQRYMNATLSELICTVTMSHVVS